MAKVAILGFGTVGSGVGEILLMNTDKCNAAAAQDIELKYIVDIIEPADERFKKYHTADFSVVENDPEVNIVVETIGGVGVAYEFTRRALMAGKNVVTSNKELVATHGLELLGIAKEKNLNYLFEASVGGGIPILRPIMQCLAANRFEDIYGILNGTTNYILMQMFNKGIDFDTALKQAQELGYAEADPTADIEGHDACRKTCILADLAFGKNVDPNKVPTEGITGVTGEDVALAGELGYEIKLLGRTMKIDEDHITAYVAPHLIPEKDLLAAVNDVYNAIIVRGNAVGETMFYGRGAGKMPTASAVVGDIIDVSKHIAARKYLGWEAAPEDYIIDADTLKSRWYARVEGGAEKLASFGKAVTTGGCSAAVSEKELTKAEAAEAVPEALSLFRVLE